MKDKLTTAEQYVLNNKPYTLIKVYEDYYLMMNNQGFILHYIRLNTGDFQCDYYKGNIRHKSIIAKLNTNTAIEIGDQKMGYKYKPSATVKLMMTTKPHRYNVRIFYQFDTIFYNLVTIEHLAEILEEHKIEYDNLSGDLCWLDIYEAINQLSGGGERSSR